MAGVRLEDVTKTFRSTRGEVRAVDGLNLAISDREMVVLVGPSGCGKTTTLRLIAGLEEPTAGTIRIGERAVNNVAPKDRDIAMVFQNYALYPHMTVFKNMAFGLKMRRVPKHEIKRKVGEVAEMLGLEHHLDRKPSALSGGERQRVALGRAIVRKPQVFLFDEPLSNLDAGLRRQMRSEIKSLQRNLETTMVYVTHDQEEAMTLGDRIIILRDGVIQHIGAPLEVYRRPANRFVGGFIGTPPMNFFSGRLEGGDDGISFDGGIGRLEMPPAFTARLRPHCGDAVVLGVRPEHLQLGAASKAAYVDRPSNLAEVGEATVHLVEPLGDSINVHLIASTGEAIITRVPPGVTISTGEIVTLFADLSQAHLFAADECGKRIN